MFGPPAPEAGTADRPFGANNPFPWDQPLIQPGQPITGVQPGGPVLAAQYQPNNPLAGATTIPPGGYGALASGTTGGSQGDAAATAPTAAGGGFDFGSLVGPGIGLAQMIGSWLTGQDQAKAAETAANTTAAAHTRAAEMQRDSATGAQNLLRDQFDTQRQDNAPWRQAGEGALNQLNNLEPFQFDAGSMQQDPGYGFRLSEGLKGMERTAAARGGLLSGGAMKSAARFADGLASQEYQNAFDRYRTQRNDRINNLQTLAGYGANANQQTGAAGQNYATGAGNLMVGAGNALAQGTIGSAGAQAEGMTGSSNARASGYVGGMNALNSALSYQQSQDLIKRLGAK